MFDIVHPFGRPITSRRLRLLDLMCGLLIAILMLLLLLVQPARAAQCNTIFLTDKNGNISFPLCPPNRATSSPGQIDNMTIGANTPAPGTFSNITNTSPTPIVQGAPNAQTVSATLTAANLQAGIITVSQGASGASTLTLPLGTAMDTAFPNAVVNSAFDFSIANISVTSGETATVAAATGFTIVGEATMAITTSGRFRARKTGTGTWVLYRLS